MHHSYRSISPIIYFPWIPLYRVVPTFFLLFNHFFLYHNWHCSTYNHQPYSNYHSTFTRLIRFDSIDHTWRHYQDKRLTFWPKLAHFHHFSFCNQSQSISILVILGQNTKAIALLFGQNWLIFITFHSAIKVNQFQFWSLLGKIPRL